MKKQITFDQSKKKLAILWFIASAVLFLILIIQTFGTKHEGVGNEVWNWLLGAILPTLSLMIGVFVADLGNEKKEKTVDLFTYLLAFYVSLFYLLVVAAIFLGQPMSGRSLLELSKSFSIPLMAFQGLVGALLGAFFVKSK